MCTITSKFYIVRGMGAVVACLQSYDSVENCIGFFYLVYVLRQLLYVHTKLYCWVFIFWVSVSDLNLLNSVSHIFFNVLVVTGHLDFIY